jgi:hypothetical protein
MARKRYGRVLTAASAGAAVGAAAAVGLALGGRRWFLSWGATPEEVRRWWPGDELSPAPASEATRAVTIHAPAAAVWRWIVQIGQDRGGFYSYTWLENLFGARIHNADRILNEHATREVGETMWMTPPERYGGKGCSRVAAVVPERALILVTPDDFADAVQGRPARHGTWAILLDPLDAATTRLVVRSRSGRRENLGRFLIFDPAHFVMERGMMLGIRDRAEAEQRARAGRAKLAA